MTAHKKKPPPTAKRSRKPVAAAPSALEQLLEASRLEVEREALITISTYIHLLFGDATFMKALRLATGKKKLTERFLDLTEDLIMKRVLRDIARHADGMY